MIQMDGRHRQPLQSRVFPQDSICFLVRLRAQTSSMFAFQHHIRDGLHPLLHGIDTAGDSAQPDVIAAQLEEATVAENKVRTLLYMRISSIKHRCCRSASIV